MTPEQKHLTVNHLHDPGTVTAETAKLLSDLDEAITAHNAEVEQYFVERARAKTGNVGSDEAVALGQRLAEAKFRLPARAVELCERKFKAIAAAQADYLKWKAEISQGLHAAEERATKSLEGAGMKQQEEPLLFSQCVSYLTRSECSAVAYMPLMFITDTHTELTFELNDKREALGRAIGG